jgi:hypothetical protein
VSLPEPIRQATLDAVNSWALRPSLLNVLSVEMETTTNVILKLERPQDQHSSIFDPHVDVSRALKVAFS